MDWVDFCKPWGKDCSDGNGSPRVSADVISETCGQTISHGSVWNLSQQLGKKNNQEDYAVKQMEVEKVCEGFLFGEMDGVWLRLRDSSPEKAPEQDIKIFTMYMG